jgi:membrane protein
MSLSRLQTILKAQLKAAWSVIRKTVERFREDNAERLAASIAFYAVFSVAPLLIIATAIAGFIFDEKQAMAEVAAYLERFAGASSRDYIVSLVNNWQDKSTGLFATIVGLGTLFWGAYRLFMALQDSLNMIWEVRPRRNLKPREWLRLRLAPFLMILITGLLLLASMLASVLLSAVERFFANTFPVPAVLVNLGNFAVSMVIIFVLTAAVFKILPDVELRWRDVWVGAALTAFLFVIGKSLIGFFLGHTSTTSIFGAAGSLVALLFWVYFSAQIFFAGVEFTQVYIAWRGVDVPPQKHAIRVRRHRED